MNQTTIDTTTNTAPETDAELLRLEGVRASMLERFMAASDARDAATKAWMLEETDATRAAYDEAARALELASNALRLATVDVGDHAEQKKAADLAGKRAELAKLRAAANPTAKIAAFVDAFADAAFPALARMAGVEAEIADLVNEAAVAAIQATTFAGELGEAAPAWLTASDVIAKVRTALEQRAKAEGKAIDAVPSWLTNISTRTYAI